MSMISEQVKKLKGFAEGYAKCGNWHIADTFREAADTIEALSAKLQAANMETGSRWIPVEVRLPENFQNVLVSFENDCERVIAYYSGMNKKWTNSNTGYAIMVDVIAWQPLPEPYRS